MAKPGKRFSVMGAGALMLLACASVPPRLAAEQPPLIPRTLLFADSQRGNPVLSADGRQIAYCAPLDGVPNIWVKTVGKADDRAVTRDAAGGIDYCFWQADGRHVLYFKDEGGDENNHLFQTDVCSGGTRDLTPIAGARAMGLIADPRYPDFLFVHLNARDKRLFDLYRIDLGSGRLSLEAKNPGDISRFYADWRMRVRAAYVTRPDNSAEVRVRDTVGSPWRPLIAWGGDQMNSDLTGVAGFSADGSELLVVTSLGANAERLLAVNLRTGARRILAEDSRYDLSALMINPIRHTLEAVCFEREKPSWTFADPAVAADFVFLQSVRSGSAWVRSRDLDDRTWLVKFESSHRPAVYYLYDRHARRASFLFSEDPKLETVVLAPKEPVSFTASDGTILSGYLTLPPAISPRDLPLVVSVHGGPWTRDFWDLDFRVQWLANRGYAVLQVNFRGSTGYGKEFQNAGNREWGGQVIQDLVDGKNWAVARGIADSKRTAIIGGSFGGYAALAALAFRPGEFACGVALNAPSDLNLFLASIPAYWAVARGRLETRMGKEPEFLATISPALHADKITAPVLLVHNANDVRVSREHSDRMAAALRARGKEVPYLLIPDAGHRSGGVVASRMSRWAAIEAFLGRHLGGRVEPPAATEDWQSLLQ